MAGRSNGHSAILGKLDRLNSPCRDVDNNFTIGYGNTRNSVDDGGQRISPSIDTVDMIEPRAAFSDGCSSFRGT
jgi:hypothetical protein